MSKLGEGSSLGPSLASSQPSVVVELQSTVSSSARTRLTPSVFDACIGPRTIGELPAASGGPASHNGLGLVRTLWRTSGSVSECSYNGDGDDEEDELLRISPPPNPSCGPLQVAVLLVLLFTLICSWEYFTRAKILMWTRWMSQHRVLGRAAFVGAYILCLVLVLPGSVLSLLAGAIFGLYWGCLVVWLGNVIGQTLAFLLARFIFRDVVRHNLEKRWPKFYLIDSAVEREGWKIVVVLRLSPILPHTIINYVLGVTKLTLWTYSWSSALSVIPYVIVFVYIGCLTKNIFEILDGSWAQNEAFLPWGIFSGVVVLLMLVYAYHFTKRAMQHALVQAVTPSLTSPTDDLPPVAAPVRAAAAIEQHLTDRARLLQDAHE